MNDVPTKAGLECVPAWDVLVPTKDVRPEIAVARRIARDRPMVRGLRVIGAALHYNRP